MTMGNFDDENEENCLTENIPTYKTFEGGSVKILSQIHFIRQ